MIKKILLALLGLVVFIVLFFGANVLFFTQGAKKISRGTPIPEYQEKRSALLVIDIQGCTTGEISLDETFQLQSEELITTTNQIIKSCRVKNIPVIYIRSELRNPFLNMINNTMATGSEGAALDERLMIVSDYNLTKNRKDAFCNPELDRILSEKSISKLFFTGLDAAHCVNSTIQAAQNRGYSTLAVRDALISETPAMKDSMMTEFSERGVGVITSDKFYAEESNP